MLTKNHYNYSTTIVEAEIDFVIEDGERLLRFAKGMTRQQLPGAAI